MDRPKLSSTGAKVSATVNLFRENSQCYVDIEHREAVVRKYCIAHTGVSLCNFAEAIYVELAEIQFDTCQKTGQLPRSNLRRACRDPVWFPQRQSKCLNGSNLRRACRDPERPY